MIDMIDTSIIITIIIRIQEAEAVMEMMMKTEELDELDRRVFSFHMVVLRVI